VSSIPIQPQNLPEKIIWYYIINTYLIYMLGAQYVFAPLLATFLTFYLLKKWWNQTEKTPADEKINISLSAWVWLIAALIIEIALIISHLNFDLEISAIIKSSLSWYRGWWMFALFVLVGHLNIRPKIIYRASCILCFQSLFVLAIAIPAMLLKLPIITYISPLKIFGGVSESYKVVFFYIFDESQTRLVLFAPWSPALGMIANVFLFFALEEVDKKWRWFGIFGSVAMIVLSVSRLAIITPPIVIVSVWLLTNFFRPWVQLTAGFVSMLLGILAPALIDVLLTFKEQFHKARAGSSKVRAALQRMAREAWWNEAPIWGHGVLEPRGPAVVGHVPIGTHHTWFGTLYIYGLVGCTALAAAFLWSFIDLLLKAQTNNNSRVGLSIILVILLFSTADTIDGYAYIYWSAAIILGIAFKQNSLLFYKTNK
jgi:hypothetical protein